MTLKRTNLEASFPKRHIGPTEYEIKEMLDTVKSESIEDLISETIPAGIRTKNPMNLPEPLSEPAFLEEFSKIMSKNVVHRSLIGMGYYDCFTPTVIQRNILENPGWYTAYTPYQAEIAQGRLEALINFQTMVIDLTGMEVANASLLDEGTAAAEAMTMFHRKKSRIKKEAHKFFVDQYIFPQTGGILETRASGVGIQLEYGDVTKINLDDPDIYGILIQYPNSDGAIIDYADLIAAAKEKEIRVVMVCDLLSLCLLKSPGEMGADAAVGTSQRFGIPMGFGGPHAAYFATKEEFKRQLPGRVIGVSKDSQGKVAYRMALQTREQHIRREKATSNICTAQVLLAVMSGMYAVYHGPAGLHAIAERVAGLTNMLHQGLVNRGLEQVNAHFFDTIKVSVEDAAGLRKIMEEAGYNLRYFDDGYVGISLDECSNEEEVNRLLQLFDSHRHGQSATLQEESFNHSVAIPERLLRTDDYLTHEVFYKYQAEHEILRYIKRLENKDLSLVHSMISLGSCTMKLNATTEMMPLSWEKVGHLHPFVPEEQALGYAEMIQNLSAWLIEITGFDDISLQPNSGAQGELAGLMTIKAFHQDRGEGHRDVTLVPSSAHGTNPASAIMAGMSVVIVDCDEHGNIDIHDLKKKAEENRDRLSSLMITYPSTHGVFEEDIKRICTIIHECGGQVYMDGANLNAQVGLTNPGIVGADVCHLNLHKTFCIPHGGGGPGMGPIAVAKHLAPYLPGNPVIKTGGIKAIDPISAAPFGSASILTISYAYIAMMGAEGLKKATEIAILSANYIKERLSPHYPILYTGAHGRCAHEMIIDCREFRKFGIEVQDIAKRLMDYGFHAPTVSFPVPGTMMIEPTESETKEEIDRFCDALINIRREIFEIETGLADPELNVLKSAPHTAEMVSADEWTMPYSRARAAYPLPFVMENKFWPSVGRIDDAYGDRNLVCACPPISVSAYVDEPENEVASI
jgi:glycine dehydrogenase